MTDPRLLSRWRMRAFAELLAEVVDSLPSGSVWHKVSQQRSLQGSEFTAPLDQNCGTVPD
jgi:hypothetical protein